MLYARYIYWPRLLLRPFDDTRIRYRCPNCFGTHFLSIAKPRTRIYTRVSSPMRETRVSYTTCIFDMHFILEHVLRGIQNRFFRAMLKILEIFETLHKSQEWKNSFSLQSYIHFFFLPNLDSRCFCAMNQSNNLKSVRKTVAILLGF